MAEVLQCDRDAAKRHQQRFLTEGVSETVLLQEAFAAHREAERQAVVDWTNKRAKAIQADLSAVRGTFERDAARSMAAAAEAISQAIARGDHRKG